MCVCVCRYKYSIHLLQSLTMRTNTPVTLNINPESTCRYFVEKLSFLFLSIALCFTSSSSTFLPSPHNIFTLSILQSFNHHIKYIINSIYFFIFIYIKGHHYFGITNDFGIKIKKRKKGPFCLLLIAFCYFFSCFLPKVPL